MEPAIGEASPTRPATELVSTIAPPLPALTIGRAASSTVWKTPVRLTSMTSCQASSPAIGAMPALATTMSSRPPSCLDTRRSARS